MKIFFILAKICLIFLIMCTFRLYHWKKNWIKHCTPSRQLPLLVSGKLHVIGNTAAHTNERTDIGLSLASAAAARLDERTDELTHNDRTNTSAWTDGCQSWWRFTCTYLTDRGGVVVKCWINFFPVVECRSVFLFAAHYVAGSTTVTTWHIPAEPAYPSESWDA